MIAGGHVGAFDDEVPNVLTEVVELVKTNSTPYIGQLPSQRHYAVGAMFNNTPMLCGGYDASFSSYYSCISFQTSQWTQTHSLNVDRSSAAGVLINSTTFWILGGSYDDGDSTEFILQGHPYGVPGPKLPYGLEEMCAVKRSAHEIFVIGGLDGSKEVKNEVWIYNPQNGFARKQGPSLKTARHYHSCSTMRDGEKTLIVVAGGSGDDYQSLDSVEIYDPTDNSWYSGKQNS